jgi:hypothetical protein
VQKPSRKFPVILVKFDKTLVLQTDFPKKYIYTQMSDFMKIRPAEVEFFHADEQTDMTKLTAAFSQFC